MGYSRALIAASDLIEVIGTAGCPLIFDVRRAEAYAAAATVVPTAAWRDHRQIENWSLALSEAAEVVVYCVHGEQVSQSVAAALRAAGRHARYLEGGIEAYQEKGGPLIAKAALQAVRPDMRPSRWVTRERPKIDRIACPWLIRRFIDRDAVFHFVAAEWVEAAAVELEAVAFDIPGAAFSHEGERCSFDAFLARFGLSDPPLGRLAEIVRGADTGRPELAPQAAGLLALSLGLSAIEADDLAMLDKGLGLYDALHGWCRFAAAETHGWPPAPSVTLAGGGRP